MCVRLQYAGTLTPDALKGRDLAFFSIFAPHFLKMRVAPIEIRFIGVRKNDDHLLGIKALNSNFEVHIDEVVSGEYVYDDRRQGVSATRSSCRLLD
jgi:hypothetical protein